MIGSLSGVKIIDLTRMLAGPYGSMILGDLGAEVIKVEKPGGGDETRGMGQHYKEGESAYFLSINRSKKSLSLDLTHEKGRQVVYDLVKVCDVVFDNYRPGALEKLGCDYEALKKVNPRIISCSISAFGHSGPYRDLPAYDLILQAMGGAMSITGEPGRAPVRMGIPMGDLAGGMFAASAISAALYARDKTGLGQKIDISLLDCQVSLLTYVAQYYLFSGEIPKPIGSGHQSVVPYGAFKTKDIYLVIAIFVEKFWVKLCKVLGDEALASDPRFNTHLKRHQNRDQITPILEGLFQKKSGYEWIELLKAEGIPAGPINTVDKVLSDPQVLTRQMVVDVDHPKCGTIQMVGNPIKSSIAEDERYDAPPLLGQHTDEILACLLGYSKPKIEDLRREGVI